MRERSSTLHDEFYVGYLATPPRLARWVRIAAGALLFMMAGSAALIASAQRDPGSARWDTGATITVEGTLLEQPYPMIVSDAGEVTLLVQTGKRGAQSRVAGHHGSSITATGWLLERDGRRILELTDDVDAVHVRKPLAAGLNVWTLDTSDTTTTLRGEIVDAKCYLGAMKPGDGKGHKACATLCISNGIPAVLASPLIDGSTRYYLVINTQAQAATSLVTAYAGEPIELTGRVGAIAGLMTITIDHGAIRRQ